MILRHVVPGVDITWNYCEYQVIRIRLVSQVKAIVLSFGVSVLAVVVFESSQTGTKSLHFIVVTLSGCMAQKIAHATCM